jgi:toxin ParE1/3/4
VRVRLTKKAEQDVAEAFDYYEQQKPDLGYRFIARVDEAIEQISENPTLFAPVIGSARRVLVDQFTYVLFYTISEDAIVIACLHGKRNPKLAIARANDKLEP